LTANNLVSTKALGLGTYTCEGCGRTFEKTRSDAEAWAEAAGENWPGFPNDMGLACDDCWRGIHWYKLAHADRAPLLARPRPVRGAHRCLESLPGGAGVKIEMDNVTRFPLQKKEHDKTITLSSTRWQGCQHLRATVDEKLAELTCADCGEKLNAIAFLAMLANQSTRWDWELERIAKAPRGPR